MWWEGLVSSGAGQSPSIGSSCSVWPQNHSRTTVRQRWRPGSSRHADSSNVVLLEDMFYFVIGDDMSYLQLRLDGRIGWGRDYLPAIENQ